MTEICGDNRFEVIAEYRKRLIESTNIESSPEEMAMIDSILFRFWQMGWIPAADVEPKRKTGRWIDLDDHLLCSSCGASHTEPDKNYCPNCGAKMDEEPSKGEDHA